MENIKGCANTECWRIHASLAGHVACIEKFIKVIGCSAEIQYSRKNINHHLIRHTSVSPSWNPAHHRNTEHAYSNGSTISQLLNLIVLAAPLNPINFVQLTWIQSDRFKTRFSGQG